MFHVYSTNHAGKPTGVGVIPGELPSTAKAGDTVIIHHSFEDKAAADAYRQQLIEYWKIKEEIVILCEQTGQIFPTAYAAAKAVGGAQSAMSNHLRGMIGHRSVKGFTFRYIPKAHVNQEGQR